MAFRFLRTRAASTPAAAAAAAGAAALGLTGAPSTASCDFQPDAPQAYGVRLVPLERSWEDLLKHEADASGKELLSTADAAAADVVAQAVAAPGIAKTQPQSCSAPAQERNLSDDADKAGSSLSSAAMSVAAQDGGQQVASFSLAPPSQAERARAIAELEHMLNEGHPSHLSASMGSWCEASATMEASERALLRARTVMAEGEDTAMSWATVGYGGRGPPSESGSQLSIESFPAEGPHAVRMLAVPVSSRSLSTSALAGSSMEISANSYSNIRQQMAEVLDKHRDKVVKIVEKPAIWNALMNDPDVLDIFEEEQVTLLGRLPPPGVMEGGDVDSGQDDGGAKHAGGTWGGGMWDFFAHLQAKLEGVVASVMQLLPQGAEAAREKVQKASGQTRHASDDPKTGANAKPWGVLGGVLAVVVAVALIVLLQRVKKRS